MKGCSRALRHGEMLHVRLQSVPAKARPQRFFSKPHRASTLTGQLCKPKEICSEAWRRPRFLPCLPDQLRQAYLSPGDLSLKLSALLNYFVSVAPGTLCLQSSILLIGRGMRIKSMSLSILVSLAQLNFFLAFSIPSDYSLPGVVREERQVAEASLF